jgi:hypothetical protein
MFSSQAHPWRFVVHLARRLQDILHVLPVSGRCGSQLFQHLIQMLHVGGQFL